MATEVSPNSYVAFYDLARCSAKIELKEDCFSALNTAIYGNNIYFYLAENADFAPFSVEVNNILQEIKSNALNKVNSEITQLAQIFEDLNRRIENEYSYVGEDIYIKILDEVKSNLHFIDYKISTNDYEAFLDALSISTKSYKLIDKIDTDCKKIINVRDKALARMQRKYSMMLKGLAMKHKKS